MTLGDPFLRALGRIMVNFAALEAHMDFVISALVGPEQPVGDAVVAELSFRTKCGVLSSLFVLRVTSDGSGDTEECLAKMKAFLKKANQLEARRNQITHSAWLIGENDSPDQATRYKITAKQDKGLRRQTEPMDVNALNAFADEIKALGEQIIPVVFDCLAPDTETTSRSRGHVV
jgi:hypothetical protein